MYEIQIQLLNSFEWPNFASTPYNFKKSTETFLKTRIKKSVMMKLNILKMNILNILNKTKYS